MQVITLLRMSLKAIVGLTLQAYAKHSNVRKCAEITYRVWG